MMEAQSVRPLRLPDGVRGALQAAVEGWWREIFVLTALNIVWAITLFTVVLAPISTAALIFVARRVLQRDPFVGWAMFLAAARRNAWPALRWGIVVMLIGGVTAANLWLYREAAGPSWAILRWIWTTIGVVWAALNLFFWPFWFAQEEGFRSLRTTWQNCFAFLLQNPAAAFLTMLLILALGIGSVLTGVLLGVLFMAATALITTAMVAAHLPPAEE
ncbi:MAG: hypothetical protein KDD73_01190 [Anaerolineales bacterium]|nr:hypothetical protein [Anaerolineales bacterium]